MSLADELGKLDELRARGVLSDDEFARAKQRLLDAAARPAPPVPPAMAVINAFRRSASDRWIGGVCGGLAQATGLDSWAWRLIVALLFFAGGTGLILYLLLWIFVPTE